MDPTATLSEMRYALAQAAKAPDLATKNAYRETACEHMESLDEWLSNGGFPPSQWPLVKPIAWD
jgi:hypothetical protein